MNIILNKNLKEGALSSFKKRNLQQKITYIANKEVDKKVESFDLISGDINTSYLENIGLVGLISFAYSNHLKLSFTPNDFWILLVSELAKEVNLNPEIYKSLFTDKEEKEEILIQHDSIYIPTDIFSKILSSKVKFDSSILFPNFTTNKEITTSILHSMFCDMSSAYYSYGMFLCGIPEIKLLGQQEDWIMLKEYADKILSIFSNKSSKIKEYKKSVANIFSKISETFDNKDSNIEFWKDIFTSKNLGSGHDLEINGWIKDLFITKHAVNKIQNFEENVSSVEYFIVTFNGKEHYKEVSGGFDIEVSEDSFYSLKYSKHIFKLNHI